MTTLQKVYAGSAVMIVAALAINYIVGERRMSRLETEVETSKQNAIAAEQRAAEFERSAARYEEKIAYLERQLTDLDTRRKEQDEQVTNAKTRTDTARRAHDDARGKRSNTNSNIDELCQRLARLGHPCE